MAIKELVPLAAQVKVLTQFSGAATFSESDEQSTLPLEASMCELGQWHLLFTHETTCVT